MGLGARVVQEKEEESNVIDFMDALKQSLGRKRAAKLTSRKKRVPPPRGRKRRAA